MCLLQPFFIKSKQTIRPIFSILFPGNDVFSGDLVVEYQPSFTFEFDLFGENGPAIRDDPAITHRYLWLVYRWDKKNYLSYFYTYYFFFVIPGAWPLAYTIPRGPFWGGGTLDTSLRPGGGVWGCLGSKLLMGRHRDWNPGPPACESGVVAFTLGGPHLLMVGILLLLWPDLCQCANYTFWKRVL